MNRPDDPINKPTQESDGHDIGCLAAIENMYAYLDGELDDPTSIADFERHIAHCRSCFTRAEMEKQLNERLKGASTHRTPARLKNRIRNLIGKF